jgi:ribosomal protein S18 acetylase RimI-like enzyme
MLNIETPVRVRDYAPSDWPHLCAIHDAARKQELLASGLLDAFLTLEQTADNEGLFDGLVLVAEDDAEVLGFIALSDNEITWLYVSPAHQRRGVARRLIRAALRSATGPVSLDVLMGNEAALKLYLSEGFQVVKQVTGKLAGNESFAASGFVLRHEAE